MIYLSHIFLGFIMGYAGLLAPGMLNMTAVRFSIEKGVKYGIIFSAGAASVVFIQALIALFFANYLNQNPHIIENLKIAGIVVFIILAIFFFMQARKQFKPKPKERRGNLFFIGMFMSSINMLAIPFYLALSAYLNTNEHLILETSYILVFVIGAVLGAFALFVTYAFFASYITKKAAFIARNINYILSILFFVLAITTLFKKLAN